MLVGHVAAGFLAKRVEPTISLGTLVLAAMLADVLWPLFTIAGLEQVEVGTGRGAGAYFHPVNIAMSHSLAMAVLWAGLFAAAYFRASRSSRGSLVVGMAVLSHWLLDAVSHRPDMPLAPGVGMYVGMGLWTSIPATLVVEGGLWVLAIIVLARATRPKKRAGVYAFWSVVVLLTLAWYNNIAGAPPPNPRTAPIASLAFFTLLVVWAYWMNRVRPVAATTAAQQGA